MGRELGSRAEITVNYSGGGGIRTLEPLARPTVFEACLWWPGFGLVEPNYQSSAVLWESGWDSRAPRSPRASWPEHEGLGVAGPHDGEVPAIGRGDVDDVKALGRRDDRRIDRPEW